MTTTLSNHAPTTSCSVNGSSGGAGATTASSAAGLLVGGAVGGRCAAESNPDLLLLGQERDEDDDVIFEDEEIASVEADGSFAGKDDESLIEEEGEDEKAAAAMSAAIAVSSSTVDKQFMTAALVSSIVELAGGGATAANTATGTTGPIPSAITANATTHSPSLESTRRKSPRKQQPQTTDAGDGSSPSCLPVDTSHDIMISTANNATVESTSSQSESPGRTIYQRATKTQHSQSTTTTTSFSPGCKIETSGLRSNTNNYAICGFPPPNLHQSSSNHGNSNNTSDIFPLITTTSSLFAANDSSAATTLVDAKCHAQRQIPQQAKVVPSPKRKKRNTTISTTTTTRDSSIGNSRSSPSPKSKKTSPCKSEVSLSMVPNPLARIQDICSNKSSGDGSGGDSVQSHSTAPSPSSSKKTNSSSNNNHKQRSQTRSKGGCLTKKTNTLMSAVVVPQHNISSSSSHDAAAVAAPVQQSSYEHRPSIFSHDNNKNKNNNNIHNIMQTTNYPMSDGGDGGGGDGQVMANIAESMFSQHYQSDGLMMMATSSSSSSGGAAGETGGCSSGISIMEETPHGGRSRFFSIDLDPAVLEFVDSLHGDKTDDEMTTSGTTNKNVTFKEDDCFGGGSRGGAPTSASRDRGFSFEFFSFGINEDEPLPPIPPTYYSGGVTSSYIPHQGNRPRGDSIIFDPTSFRDGGIHETAALMQHVTPQQEISVEVVGSTTSDAAAPASQQQEMRCMDAQDSLTLDLNSTSSSAMHHPQRQRLRKGGASSSDASPSKTLQGKTSSKRSRSKAKHPSHRAHSSRLPNKSSPSLPPIHEGQTSAATFQSPSSPSSSRMYYPQAFSENTIHMPHGSDAAAAAIAGGGTSTMLPSSSSTIITTTTMTTITTNTQDGYSVSHTSCPMDLLNKDGRIGIYLPEERRSRIAKFHSKRMVRTWRKKIKYDCRKKLADSRPRIKGRFVKRSDVDGE